MQPRIEKEQKPEEVISRSEIQDAIEAQYAQELEEEKERDSCFHRFFGCWLKEEAEPESFVEPLLLNRR